MKSLFFILSLLVLSSDSAYADPTAENWFLPMVMSDQNTSLKFDLDSTWHTVHGVVRNISGSAELAEVKDLSSIKISAKFPVASFNTGNSSRDKEMRQVMAATQYAVVTFASDRLSGGCLPSAVIESGSCKGILEGRVTIRSLTKIVEIPVTIEKNGDGFLVKGSLPIRWAEFGVEDPSILVAHVDPIVTVRFEVQLGPKSIGEDGR